MRGPWPDEVAQLVTGPHETTCRVTINRQTSILPDIELDVTSLRIGWDEARAPRCTATITCPLPEASILERLDPRHLVRAQIRIGYHLRSGKVDEQLIATLDLRAIEEVQPDGVMVLELAGVESRVMDVGLPVLFTSPSQSVVGAIAANVILTSTPGQIPFVWDPRVTDRVQPFPDAAYGQERWSVADDLADSLGADLYDPGNGTIVLAPRPRAAGKSIHVLRTGPRGTATRVRSRRSREGFNNWVHLRYDNGTGDPATWVYGNADDGGVVGWEAVGMVTFVETRRGNPTQETANATAAAVLQRQLTGGRSYSCEAIAAWWLRAGDTTSVETFRDPQERHLVARVEMSWPENRMSVTTRYPEA